MRDAAAVHEGYVVGEVVGLLQVLGGQQDRRAVPPEFAHGVVDLAPAGRVQSGGRLVEEEDPGPADQGGGEVQAAAHAARVGGGGPVGGLLQPEPGEQVVGARRRAAHPVQTGEEPQVLPPGEVAVDRGVLPHDADGAAHGRGLPDQVVAGDPGRARVGAQQGGQQPDRGGLARAVGSQDRADRAPWDGEVEAAQGAHLAEPLLQTFTKYIVRRSHAATIAHYVRCT